MTLLADNFEVKTVSDRQLRDFYQENGFLVVPQALSMAQVEELRQETEIICRGEREVFEGVNPARPDETTAEVMSRYLCIHFPHKLSELMLKYISYPAIVEVLQTIIGPNVKCMQSMLFIKAAAKPGQAWHQDEFFIPTRDRSLTGAWIALDDATVENGCLWVLPGSHKPGIIYPQHAHNDSRFDCSGEAYGYSYRDEDARSVEVRAGSIVFFNGYLLHRSLPNQAKSGFRRALVNHYMSAESLLPWALPGPHESMATADFRDIVMVCGNDPYAYKGMAEHSSAHVRPSGEGGCATPA